MLDVLHLARQRLADPAAPRACAVATIVGADGSVPRPIGTSMLVDAGGTIQGSLSGGCVEGAVLEACHESMETGASAMHRFGYSDEDAFAVGLMCGGTLEVLVQPFRSADAGASADDPLAIIARLPSRAALSSADEHSGRADEHSGSAEEHGGRAEEPSGDSVTAPDVAVLDDVDELPEAVATLVPREILSAAEQQTATMVREGRTGTIRLAPPGGAGEPIELFIESRTLPAHLVVFGANAFGQALVEAARPLGLRITLCDQRPAFAAPASFPGAEVVRAWPHEYLAEAAENGDLDARSLVCVLTHDPKVDVPALKAALDLEVAYVGAMGSRRSDRDRRAALREAGVAEESLARLHSPIGLDLGAVTPAEVAVSILAEVLAVREKRGAVRPLSSGDGPLHPRTA